MKQGIIVAIIVFVAIIGIFSFTGNPSGETSSISTSNVVEVPEPVGYVNDISDIIPPDVQSSMESYLTEFAKSGKGEIAVLTLPSTGDETIEQFGIKLGDKWKVGNSEEDNGVILIVASVDRQVRIEVGKGAEAFITDSRAGQILDDVVVPEFKNGNWAQGINNGVIQVANEMSN